VKYAPTPADRAPAPPDYRTAERYLGYRTADYAQPYASYFTEQVAPVQPHVREAVAAGRQPSQYGYRVEDAAARMSRPGYEAMETGYTGFGGRSILVSVLTDMPGVCAEDWDWWFGWHGTETARYKLWHPGAHFYTAVGENRSADRTLTDRQRYIGNVSYVDEYLGADASALSVRFLDPCAVGFDQPTPGNTVIAARGGFSTSPLSFAWLIHQVRATSTGCEMRSRFFVNDLEVLRLPAHSIAGGGAGRILTTPIGRAVEPIIKRVGGVKVDHFGPVMLMHCGQEMNHLAAFLPRLRQEFQDLP
jgi:DAPG hydrolase PhiG domain